MKYDFIKQVSLSNTTPLAVLHVKCLGLHVITLQTHVMRLTDTLETWISTMIYLIFDFLKILIVS